MVLVEINDELRVIICDWMLVNLKGNKLLRNWIQQSITDSSDEETYITNKKKNKSPMGIECFYALSNKFSRPIWIYLPSGEILKNFECFGGEAIKVEYDGNVHRVVGI
jgi:hypothetical protein